MSTYGQIKRHGQTKGYEGEPKVAVLQGQGGRLFFLGYWDTKKYGQDPFSKKLQRSSKIPFNGFGTLFNPADGQEHYGDWENNVLIRIGNIDQGMGLVILDGEHLYEGNIVNGKANGKGTITYGNMGGTKLDRYEGEVQNGQPHGKGKLMWHFGVEFEGNFDKGKMQGPFTLRLPNDVRIEAVYNNDTLTQFKVTAPENHPLKSEQFQKPTIHTPSEKWASKSARLCLGDINGYSISFDTLNGAPQFIYEGDHKDGLLKGQGSWVGLSSFHAVKYEGHFTVDLKPTGRTKKTEIFEKKITSGSFDTGVILQILEGESKEKGFDGVVEHTRSIQRPFQHIGFLRNMMARAGALAANDDYHNTEIKQRLQYQNGKYLGKAKSSHAPSIQKANSSSKSEIVPLSPEDNRGQDDIHGNPEKRAKRIVQQQESPNTKFIVADGSLYVKGALGGIFGQSIKRYDLESATIIENTKVGTVEVSTGSADILCDKLHGTVKELANALRIERARIYPNSPQAKSDQATFPGLNWDSHS